MYAMAKSRVRRNNLMSEYFLCNIGVRQGDNLSPLLFVLFINDFSKYIEGKYRGLSIDNCYPTLLDNDIAMLNMFVLLYADDTIVLAENASAMLAQWGERSLSERTAQVLFPVRPDKTYTVFY